MINNFRGPHRFLSNFYPCVLTYDGVTYPSLEHAYQALKTVDQSQRDRILKSNSPGKAKILGSDPEITTLRPGWNDENRIRTMLQLLRVKFSDPVLALQLLSTGSEELVEGNTWKDRFWGVYQGEGQNYLGVLLMHVREELKIGKLIDFPQITLAAAGD